MQIKSIIKVRQAYRGALWVIALPISIQNVIVVEEDMMSLPTSRSTGVRAPGECRGEGIVVFTGIFGSPIDPSTPLADRDVSRLGTGYGIASSSDATRSWKFERKRSVERALPPTVRPAERTRRACGRAGAITASGPHVKIVEVQAIPLALPLRESAPGVSPWAAGTGNRSSCACHRRGHRGMV